MDEEDDKDALSEKDDLTILDNAVQDVEKKKNDSIIIKADHNEKNGEKNGSTIIIKDVTNDDEHEPITGLPKQSLLLRLFESKLFNMELTLSYLNNSKDSGKFFCPF